MTSACSSSSSTMRTLCAGALAHLARASTADAVHPCHPPARGRHCTSGANLDGPEPDVADRINADGCARGDRNQVHDQTWAHAPWLRLRLRRLPSPSRRRRGLGDERAGHVVCTPGARASPGSDANDGPDLAPLHAIKIPIATGASTGGLPEDRNLLIHSAAIPPEHPELLEAQQRGLEVLSYAEALGKLQADLTGISIAGTHGKSTTSALLAHILTSAGLDPSVIVGAHCPQLGGGWRVGAPRIKGGGPMNGRPGLMICEACEFNRSFHHHHPMMALINNIEEDHLDVYAGIEEIVTAFRSFAELIPPEEKGGYLLIAHEGAHRRKVVAGMKCAVESFGFAPDADWRVQPVDERVQLVAPGGSTVMTWRPTMPGTHNTLNNAAAAILAHRVGASWEAIRAASEDFEGLERRTQLLGTRALPGGGQVTVIDDYGHHLSEIEATLRAVRIAQEPRRVICVFQPHQHSRTRFLLEEFATSFDHADIVIVPQIHFVRDSEAERQRVSAGDLVDRLRDRGTRAMHVHPFEAIVEQLEVICHDGDLVVVMGAGTVWKIGHDFLAAGKSMDGRARVDR